MGDRRTTGDRGRAAHAPRRCRDAFGMADSPRSDRDEKCPLPGADRSPKKSCATGGRRQLRRRAGAATRALYRGPLPPTQRGVSSTKATLTPLLLARLGAELEGDRRALDPGVVVPERGQPEVLVLARVLHRCRRGSASRPSAAAAAGSRPGAGPTSQPVTRRPSPVVPRRCAPCPTTNAPSRSANYCLTSWPGSTKTRHWPARSLSAVPTRPSPPCGLSVIKFAPWRLSGHTLPAGAFYPRNVAAPE